MAERLLLRALRAGPATRSLALTARGLRRLPRSLGNMKALEGLSLRDNKLRRLPQEMEALGRMEELELEELYCEDNPLLERIPVSAVQEEDILTLKELTARFIFTQLENENIYLHRALKKNSQAQNILSHKHKCAQCGCAFLGMWLECVHFVDVKQRMKTSRNLDLLPVRALLCSYKCFNHRGHGLFGIAVP